MTGDLAHAVHAACEHGAGQRAAGEAVHPTLHGLLRALEGLRRILGCRCQQIRLGKGIVRIIERIGAIQHGLELTADTVIVDGRCEHQHIRIVHFGGNFHGIVLDDAVPQLQAGKTALAEANLLFPQRYGFYLIACLPCALGEGCRQRFGVAALAGTGGNDQYLFIHRKTLLAF